MSEKICNIYYTTGLSVFCLTQDVHYVGSLDGSRYLNKNCLCIIDISNHVSMYSKFDHS
jgi:hypothetical protein